MPAAYVYRIYDGQGLIYIGSTRNLWQRLQPHRSTSWWAPTVVKVRAELRPNYDTARRDEQVAIYSERPRHNLAERRRELRFLPEDEFREYVYSWVRYAERSYWSSAGDVDWSSDAGFGRYARRRLRTLLAMYQRQYGHPLNVAAVLPPQALCATA